MRRWLAEAPFPSRRFAWLVGVGALASLLADWPLGAILVAFSLFSALVADGLRAVAPGKVAVDRLAPAVVPLGEERQLSWRLTNTGDRLAVVALADEPDPSLAVAERRHQLALAPGATDRVASSFQPTRRGDRALHALTVRTTGPWGLAHRQQRRPAPTVIRVHPPARGRRQASARVALGLEIGERLARTTGVGTEFDHLREWQHGDEVRRVDWRATARVGRPVVRTFRAERNQRVVVSIDTGRAVAGLVDDVPRLDHLMDGAIAIATLAAAMGDRFGLFAHAARTRLVVPPVRAVDAPRRAADALYRLDARLEESDHRGAVLEVLARVRRRSVVVVLADLQQPAASRELIPALRNLATRHLVLVGAILDPALAAAPVATVDRPDEAWGRAAAVAALVGREQARQELERAGIRTVDAAPEGFSRALIEAYLDLRLSARV